MKKRFQRKDLSNLYDTRFSVFERIRKDRLWKVLCQEFLQRYIPTGSVVLDIGAGNCEFINNIAAGEKIAMDLNPLAKRAAGKDVKVYQRSAEEIDRLFKNRIDVAFMSNFLEHLEDRETVHLILKKTYRALKPGGRLLVMQPDIRRVGHEYWDFFDHRIPITEKSLIEVLLSVGFELEDKRSPFLPYSTRTWWMPMLPGVLKLYLRIRPAQWLFGKQFFVCVVKR